MERLRIIRRAIRSFIPPAERAERGLGLLATVLFMGLEMHKYRENTLKKDSEYRSRVQDLDNKILSCNKKDDIFCSYSKLIEKYTEEKNRLTMKREFESGNIRNPFHYLPYLSTGRKGSYVLNDIEKAFVDTLWVGTFWTAIFRIPILRCTGFLYLFYYRSIEQRDKEQH